MQKQIFSEEDITPTPTVYQTKQEFDENEFKIEQDADAYQTFDDTEDNFTDEAFKPSRFWLRALMAAFVLFGIAVIAQSVQWLIDAVNQQQWISLFFALAFMLVSLSGISVIVKEWRTLVKLRKHDLQQKAATDYQTNHASGEKAQAFCNTVIQQLTLNTNLTQTIKEWETQVHDYHNAEQVMTLFSQNVLTPLDKKAQKLIAKHAKENAIIVAISPLAIVDILMMAWRNIALINQISRIYGMELGYFSRLKLIRTVIWNMVFTGATEIATTMLPHSLLGKLLGQATQGIGVGILTSRLGIKAMEYCRPIRFQPQERPDIKKISVEIYQALINSPQKDNFVKTQTEKSFVK